MEVERRVLISLLFLRDNHRKQFLPTAEGLAARPILVFPRILPPVIRISINLPRWPPDNWCPFAHPCVALLLQFHAQIAVVFYKGRQPIRQDITVATERSDIAPKPSAKGQVHKLGSAEVINFSRTLATFVRGAIAKSEESVREPHEDGKEREGI